MTEPIQVRFTPSVQSIAAFVQPHVSWIEQMLGVAYGDTLTLEFYPNAGSCIAGLLLKGASIAPGEYEAGIPWREYVTEWHLPPHTSPRVRVSRCRKPQGGGAPVTSWAAEWQECPVAVTLRGVEHPVVMMNVPANFPGEAAGIEFRSWFITRRDDARAVLAALDKLISGAAKFIHGIQAPVPIPVSYDWDSLVLSEAITELVRRDFELFFTREPWFRKHGLPYRRGYLLYGPAGNGKTSVIRVMAAHPQIRAYALDLSGPDASGAEVWRLFRTAQRNAPALVILEDLDRIFPRDGLRDATRQNTFQALLNNLDGIGTYDGLIVVGTANDPTALDASILRRPGRFDRVVAFALPTGGLRQQYFQKFKIACTGEQMSEAVQESDGLSFAQLREAYILAGQHAFERDDQITGTDLLAGIQRLRNGVKLIWEPKTPLGFSGVRLHAPNPDGVYS